MPFYCKACKALGEPKSKAGKPVCAKCGSDNIISQKKKRLSDIDQDVMPYTRLSYCPDLTKMKLWKLSTFTDETSNEEYMVIHKPIDPEHLEKGNEMIICPPPCKAFFWIGLEDYKANRKEVDQIALRFKGTIHENIQSLGTEQSVACKIEFQNDLLRKSAAFKLGKIVKTYESHRPLQDILLVMFSIQVLSLPTRLFLDIEVDPRDAPNLGQSNGRILTICAVDHNKIEYRWNLESYDDDSEKKILIEFFKKVFHYSTACGFYSAKFDIPYTQLRAQHLGIGWDWDFINAMDFHNIYTTLQATNWDENKFTLDAIAKREFNEGKLEIKDYTEIWDMWVAKDPRLVEYCLKDADLVRRLNDKWEGIDARLVATNLTYTRCDAYTTYLTGLENIIMKFLHDLKPMQVLYTPNRGKDLAHKFEGAMVFPPIKGTHQWVVFLDFKSMYNRIIQSLNFGFDTLDPKGEIVTPFARFTNKRETILRKVLQHLEYWREYYNNLKKKEDPDSTQWLIYDKKQWNVKYYLVSTYGVLGSSYSYLYNKANAASITWAGQQLIQVARQVAEFMGYPVIYGDTDSIAMKVLGATNMEQAVKIAEFVREKITIAINYFAKTRFNIANPNFEVGIDKVFSNFWLSHAKKKYTGWLVRKEDKVFDTPKLHVTGFESKRTDWSKFLKLFQMQLFEMRLNGKPEADIIRFIRTCISMVYNSEVDDLIVQHKVLRKRLKDYKAIVGSTARKFIDIRTGKEIVKAKRRLPPIHVRAAEEWATVTGEELRIAQEIKYHYGIDGTIIPIVDGLIESALPKSVYDYVVKEQMYAIISRMDIDPDLVENKSVVNKFSRPSDSDKPLIIGEVKKEKEKELIELMNW